MGRIVLPWVALGYIELGCSGLSWIGFRCFGLGCVGFGLGSDWVWVRIWVGLETLSSD